MPIIHPLLSHLAADSLGALVEFQSPESIRREYPGGVRELADGGRWDTVAGQPTDDGEMTLALARSIVHSGRYDRVDAKRAYMEWYRSGPFDCGNTIEAGLHEEWNHESQANGALMRAVPLGLLCAGRPITEAREVARLDGGITHPNPVCIGANELYVAAIAHGVDAQPTREELFERIRGWAHDWRVAPSLVTVIETSRNEPPADYTSREGWVLIAFGNALWQLLHAENLEEGIVDSVMRGGDTDTNAAICGGLLGSLEACGELPERWIETLLQCRPEQGGSAVYRPRPEEYWPREGARLEKELMGMTGSAQPPHRGSGEADKEASHPRG